MSDVPRERPDDPEHKVDLLMRMHTFRRHPDAFLALWSKRRGQTRERRPEDALHYELARRVEAGEPLTRIRHRVPVHDVVDVLLGIRSFRRHPDALLALYGQLRKPTDADTAEDVVMDEFEAAVKRGGGRRLHD